MDFFLHASAPFLYPQVIQERPLSVRMACCFLCV